MSVKLITKRLQETEATILNATYSNAISLLDHSPRFKYFTLHGESHLSELFRILDILLEGGLILNDRELYLLGMAICTHDLGMIIGLSDSDLERITQGRGGVPDPVNFENFIRDVHHEIISEYFRKNINFMTSLGVSITDLGIISEIGECHRKVLLRDRNGMVKKLGALLRVIDELDVGGVRAPAHLFENNHHEMDHISKWHWFKHSITEEWHAEHNVKYTSNKNYKEIEFQISVRPTRIDSIPYWETQVSRPIIKALKDDDAQSIILESYGVKISVIRSSGLSRVNSLGGFWARLEDDALTQGRKVILVVDDEVKKIEDSFFPLMDEFHVKCIPYPRAAIDLMKSVSVNIIVIDLQMNAQDFWSELETDNSRMTGFCLAAYVSENFSKTKICILSGTKHQISNEDKAKVDLFLRKPIDPFELANNLKSILP